MLKTTLMQIAHARSGDKGDTVNIGLIGRSPECYAWLEENITSEKVKTWFKTVCKGSVTRYEAPNLWSLNFVLTKALGGGGTKSLFIDPQGKTYGQALLRYEVEIPKTLLDSIHFKHRTSKPDSLPNSISLNTNSTSKESF